ncbi:MAG: thioredoxin family protein, partial [Planctomycetaceae bacterium]|nr:thioredoxin family protein [Planctomycetaceae bacterium]
MIPDRTLRAGRLRHQATRAAILLALFTACAVLQAASAVATDAVASLEDAYRRAIADRKPVLICIKAKWSEPSRKLAKEFEEKEVAAELARWISVTLDVDAQAADVEDLGITTAPALRIVTPTGQHVASCDRYLPPDELVAWLKKHHDAAIPAADDALLSSGEPSITAVIKLVKQFDDRNPALREAAIRRLMPYPDAAKTAVVKAFCERGLSSRLVAMELLDGWHAPLQGLDPWRPETFTPRRLARLEKWKDQTTKASDQTSRPLTTAELASAREQLDRLLRADAADADA